MKKIIFITFFTLSGINNFYAQVSSSLSIDDTRAINELPNYYQHGLRADFKERNAILVPGEGYYSTTITLAQWDNTNNSGDKNHQLNFNNGGLFYRNAYPLDSQWGNWRKLIVESENGNVGIGNALPTYKLDIDNAEYGAKQIRWRAPNGKYGYTYSDGGGIGITNGDPYSELIYLQTSNKSINFYTDKKQVGVIDALGNFGFGTTNPDSKLTVAGNIHAQEVKVTVNAGVVPDYVFANDYKLKSLQEVEDFIKQNNHLPEIPSAKEIEKNGLMLAEMNMSLLKKIEELTLYVIEQNKKMTVLEKKIEALEAK